MKNLLILLPLVAGLAIGCKSSDSSAVQPDNTITFSATDWTFRGVGDKGDPGTYTSNRTSSGNSYSLSAASSSATKDTTALGYWVTNFGPGKAITVGKTLTLKAKVRLDNVQGSGVSLVLRGDTSLERAALFATTQNQRIIRGTSDYTEYSVSMPYTKAVDELLIFLLVLPKTTGTVSFSDVSVQVN